MSIDTSKFSEDSFDEGFERPPSSWVKWGKVGDVIKGTLIGVTEQDNSQKPGEKQKVYEIEVDAGFFHNIVDKVVQPEPTELDKGDVVNVGGKSIIDKAMRKADIGQKVIMRYTGDFKLPNGNTAKTVSVKLGGMDPNWTAKPSAAVAAPSPEIPFGN
jgi:hypothetical protein